MGSKAREGAKAMSLGFVLLDFQWHHGFQEFSSQSCPRTVTEAGVRGRSTEAEPLSPA